MHVPLLALTGAIRCSGLICFRWLSLPRAIRCELLLPCCPRRQLDSEIIAALKAAGLMRVAFWLHGSSASLDDAHWQASGSHRRTLAIIGSCHEARLPVQINTMLSRRNFNDVDPMIELLDAPGRGIVECVFSGAVEPCTSRRNAHSG